jgi:hypothetical protein
MFRLTAFFQTTLLLITVLIAYLWLKIPNLSQYSLQIFALSVLIYFLVKRLTKAKIWHLAPTEKSPEIVIASFAILMLIGATGNANSIFFPISYLHLFFLAFSTRPVTAFLITGAIIWFHYSLGINLDLKTVSDLATLPLILTFFLFAKKQYQEVITKNYELEQEKNVLSQENQEVDFFINSFLKPKLSFVKQALSSSFDSQASQEISDIKQAVDIFEQHLDDYIEQTKNQTINETSKN